MTEKSEIHNKEIKEQFAKQAKAYTALSAHTQDLIRLFNMAEPTVTDRVLDVACGSGIVGLAFAAYVEGVTGIDLTPEMLDEAKRLQKSKGLNNVEFIQGDVNSLPFEDDTFEIVISRFSFHHLNIPKKVLSEMVRVCKPGGLILVADVALPDEKKDRYNEMELLRDSSHVSALSVNEHRELFVSSGLITIQHDNYYMEIELEDQLKASFCDKEKLRRMIIEDVGIDTLGIKATQFDDSLKMYYPIHIFAGRKPEGSLIN
ncbi:class I SAM-dependent methyltransferase [Desertivirga brevis]|uniref:class I SAM-dependent methyltransferase n=1 Tax=Desertivirga brevis TaxID=2810310 RepID=UPI001A961542|nr:class I SAM-dependent methyltransferase [Pedobacter sp. SYSU D00873]